MDLFGDIIVRSDILKYTKKSKRYVQITYTNIDVCFNNITKKGRKRIILNSIELFKKDITKGILFAIKHSLCKYIKHRLHKSLLKKIETKHILKLYPYLRLWNDDLIDFTNFDGKYEFTKEEIDFRLEILNDLIKRNE